MRVGETEHAGPPLAIEEMASGLFREIAEFSRDDEGVSRPAFSALETRALEHLAEFARSHGLEVWFDEGLNAHFCLRGDREAPRYVLIGSHVDSVPQGGNFDGLAGVIAGLMCLLHLAQSPRRPGIPLHVIAMRAEEGAWFGPCYIGSKILTGQLGANELAAVHRGDRRSLDDHIAGVGLPVERIRQGQPLLDLSRVAVYLELHIEQGPLLIGKNIPAAVVSGIRGNIRFPEILCRGEPGHSGAVPKAYRRDAVLAAADLLTRLDESWTTILNKGDDLVFTCGMIATDPAQHAVTRIPDVVRFSLDIRSQSAATLAEMRELLAGEIREVSRDRRVTFDLGRESRVMPAVCDARVVQKLQRAMRAAGQEPFVMASGAGHDAAVFAEAGIPSAMVFVRNRNGSHNPAEAMEISDFRAGVDVLQHFLAAT